ncbi:hypothetical protein [Acinetobacter sp. YH12052]|uniref:hypothetical protein n=1 Tax=Acinetobacter sp. YH12052 TaxID=2601055 RepID=UPI00211E6689|nr:hypothetical protein [Acinetobacter sp. YH12052]
MGSTFKNSKNYLMIFIIFFFLFGMKTPLGSLAQILTAVIVAAGIVVYGKYLVKADKLFFFLMAFLIYDYLVCLTWVVMAGTYDFKLLITKTNLIISVVATYILSIYFFRNYTKKQFFVFLSIVFLIQSLIVVLMLLNSDIANFITTYTKDENVVERMMGAYSGARGLGIADSGAFGFSIVMALFLLLTFASYKKGYINGRYFFIVISLGLVASISAGRVAMLGMFMGLFLWTLYFKKIKILRLATLTLCGFVLLFSFLISLRHTVIEHQALATFYNYSMEPIFNYIDYGEFSSSSTDHLETMYFPLTEKQWLLGDAKYMNGIYYYMNTDAGYMRFALFYGAINSFIYYLFFIIFSAYACKKINNLDEKIIIVLMVLLSFLLHYKAEVILLAIAYNKLLLLVVFFLYAKSISAKQRESTFSIRYDH